MAANPFEERWWLGTDSPFQLLAACLDLSDALELDDPTSHVSHIAVHQDGSCNGLQHYAALLKDRLGGEQVNLTPSEQPQDVYAGVRALVAQKVEDDAATIVQSSVRAKQAREEVEELEELLLNGLLKVSLQWIYGLLIFAVLLKFKIQGTSKSEFLEFKMANLED